jgi:hypothetical protein
LPTLRDNTPTILLEGPSSELDFPDLEDAVGAAFLNDTKVNSPFGQLTGPVSTEKQETDGKSTHLQRKIDELVKELELRQSEYASNLREQEN